MVKWLDDHLARLADIVARDLRCDFRATPGAGAAGGLGFGLLSFCGATLRSGFETLAEILQLEKAIAASDFIITGEGRIDAQTLEGKGPAGVAALARKHGKPVIAFAGSVADDPRIATVFDQVWPVQAISVDAGKPLGETEAHLAFLRRRRAQLRHDEGRQKAPRRARRTAPAASLLPRPQPALHGRRLAGVEMGQHQHLHRGCAGPAGLRLDDRRPDLRHLPRARRAALRGDRFHAAGPLDPPEPYQHEWRPGARLRQDRHRLGLPAEGLRQVGRARLPVGEALRRPLRPRRGRTVVLGSLERGQRRLLLARTPEEFYKLHDYAIAAVRRALPTARVGGPDSAGAGGKFTENFLQHVVHGQNYATGQTGTPTDFLSFHAKGSPGFVDGHVRLGIAAQLKTIDAGSP
jgi:hypothetical protein